MKVKYALKKVWEKQKSIKKKMQIHPKSDFSEVTVVSLIEGRFFTSWATGKPTMVNTLYNHLNVFEKAMAPHSSTLAWKIPCTEEPGGLQSMGSLRVGYDWVTSLSLFTFMHWRRKWQPTPVFLPGESQGRGSLVGCHPWGPIELDTTEVTQQQMFFMCICKIHVFSKLKTLYIIFSSYYLKNIVNIFMSWEVHWRYFYMTVLYWVLKLHYNLFKQLSVWDIRLITIFFLYL